MPVLQSTGAISINDIKTLFGGPAAPALSNYYRGGAYIPTTKTVNVREPSSGYNYTFGTYFYQYGYWSSPGIGKDPGTSGYSTSVYWNGVSVYFDTVNAYASVTVSGVTYYANTYISAGNPDVYGVYRTYNSTVSINTGIPSSGQISISQFYGAELP